MLNFELQYSASDLNVGLLPRDNLNWLLKDFKCSILRRIVLQDKFLDQRAINYPRVSIADALIIDNEIAVFTASKHDNFVTRHGDQLEILAIRHAKHFK